jgi:hypothetical protein
MAEAQAFRERGHFFHFRWQGLCVISSNKPIIMKKLLLAFSAAFMMFSASAQIEKGTVFVGASSSFGVNSYNPSGNGDNTTSVNLNLKAGYFVIENLTVGLNFGYDHSSTGDNSSSSTKFGIFGRYYFMGKVFAGLGVNSVSNSPGDSSAEIPIEVGYAAFITKNIAIEPSLNFVKGDGGNTFGLNVGFSLYLNRGE